jgi:hypothetical protein
MIYSSTLDETDLARALAAAPGLGFAEIERLDGTRLAARGWRLSLCRAGSLRRFNTGTHGGGEQGAASRDDWGHFLAALYEADPRMRFRGGVSPYENRDDFRCQTRFAYDRAEVTDRFPAGQPGEYRRGQLVEFRTDADGLWMPGEYMHRLPAVDGRLRIRHAELGAVKIEPGDVRPAAGQAAGAVVPYSHADLHVNVTLPFRYGTIDCAWTDLGHVHVSAGTRKAVTEFRGRLWNVRVDLWEDTGWTEATGRPGISDRLSEFTSYNRADEDWTLPKTMAVTHRAAVVREIRSAVLAFLAQYPEVPEVPLTAEANRLRRIVVSEEARAREAYRQAREHDQNARAAREAWLSVQRAVQAQAARTGDSQ